MFIQTNFKTAEKGENIYELSQKVYFSWLQRLSLFPYKENLGLI